MKQQNTKFCLKARWGSFAVLLTLGIMSIVLAWYGNTPLWVHSLYITFLICMIMAGMLLRMNLRRKRIQKEFLYELDKDIQKRKYDVHRMR